MTNRDDGSRSQTDVVVDGVKQMIVTGELAAGARLPVEKELAARLGVSRGSLREGVRALTLTGVLETRQGAGTFVTALDPGRLLGPVRFLAELNRPGDLADLQSVRRVLEVEAAGRAALRITGAELERAEEILAALDGPVDGGAPDHQAAMEADLAFHRVIAGAAGNATLAALIDVLAGRTVRARLWRAIEEEGAGRATHHEHRAILAALRSGDPEAARLRMGVHLLAVEQYLAGRAGGQAPPRPAQ
ncbi:FadR/GntR family transcriptional regulator [Streptomyces harbinensis]|uniref:DNA-binding transcriptional regulator, FadR family n=1 Tax=Streptomyces harbinensis TaxID=1176198 RepID=A0A1I6V771_9ACTN|nr:FadR/GntR family transcriptional regulator [Streptomyces harbinensis]SFT09506.1 DNA-binding transcriptional regulator, FadR family [Streptomyces harbinensis]